MWREISNETGSCENVSVKLKLIDLILKKIEAKKHFYSLEVSPSNNKIDFNKFKVSPLMVSITWLSDSNLLESSIENAPALKMAKEVRSFVPVLSHLTCHDLTETQIDAIFNTGIVDSVLALKGDTEISNQEIKSSKELIAILRRKFQDSITIAVAGYPLNPNAEAISQITNLKFLKEKIDAGADFIITQFSLSSDAIINFVKNCRDYGINCPIIPGIFIPHSFKSLITMCKLCKVRIPDEDFKLYFDLRDNTEEFQAFAHENGRKLLVELFENVYEKIYGVHFFTLNNLSQILSVVNLDLFE